MRDVIRRALAERGRDAFWHMPGSNHEKTRVLFGRHLHEPRRWISSYPDATDIGRDSLP